MRAANQKMPCGRVKRRIEDNGLHPVRKKHLRLYAQIKNPILITTGFAQSHPHPSQSWIESGDDLSDGFSQMQALLGRCQHKPVESRCAKAQKAGLKLFEFLFDTVRPLLGIEQRLDIPADVFPHTVDLFARRQWLVNRHIRVVIHQPVENRFKGYPAAYRHGLVRRSGNELDRRHIEQTDNIIIDEQALLTLAGK